MQRVKTSMSSVLCARVAFTELTLTLRWSMNLYLEWRTSSRWRLVSVYTPSIIVWNDASSSCTNMLCAVGQRKVTWNIIPSTHLWWTQVGTYKAILGWHIIFFFCVPQLYLWGSPFLVRCLRMWLLFNPTIKVVTFHLRGWCILGVFLLPAFTTRTWTSGSFESVRWNACVHRLDLGLYSHPSFFGNGVWTHVNSKGKIPSTGKFPQRRIEPATLWTASPKTTNELFRPRLTHYERVSTSAFSACASGQCWRVGFSLNQGLNVRTLVWRIFL